MTTASGTRPHVHKHQELLILMYKLLQLIYTLIVQRWLDTIILISVYVIFHDFMIIILKKTTYGHSNKRDQIHGRSNKLPIKKSFFSLSVLLQ